jgi:hypothetical protein
MKKKAPALEQVNHAVLQGLHPEHIEVEICRAEELEHRRGLALVPIDLTCDLRHPARSCARRVAAR